MVGLQPPAHASDIGRWRGRWYSPSVKDAADGTNEIPELAGFREALDSSFRVHLDANGHIADLTLLRVADRPARAGWESFSLIFASPHPPAFRQGTFAVEHPDLGSFPVFLVAVATEGGGQEYEAIFNRPRPDGRRAS